MKTKEPYPDKHYPDGLTFEDALRYHDEDLVSHLIRKGLDPNSRSKDGKPLLLAAEAAGAFRVVDALRKAGASAVGGTEAEREVAERPSRRKSVLDKAAFRILLKELKSAGIEVPTLQQWQGRKPASRAAAAMIVLLEEENEAWLRRLLEVGADPNEYLYGKNDDLELPLDFAADRHPCLVPVLLEYGADPSGDGDECIPLISACDAEDKQLAYRLLEAGAAPFAERWNGFSPLYAAVLYEREDLVECLLKRGVDPNGDEEGEHIPLSAAISNQNLRMVRMLLDAGASPFRVALDFTVAACTGYTPLYDAESMLRMFAAHRRAEERRYLVHARRIWECIYARYPDIDPLPYPGYSSRNDLYDITYFNACLWNAAAYGLRRDVVHLLYYFGASADACNKAGIPALVVAAARGHTEVVYELLCYGSRPELPPHLLLAAGCEGAPSEEILRLIRCFQTGCPDPKKSAE